MRDKILKLAKRLNKFTLDEIESILGVENTGEILEKLVEEKILQFKNNNYFYVKQNQVQTQLPNFFQFHTKEEIGMIVKCFCADVPVLKTTLLVDSSKTVVGNFYKYFRDEIHRKQLSELKEYFANNPKIPAIRSLYGIKVYLYFYGGKVFVADKELKSIKSFKKHSEVEMREIRVAYYKVRRIFQNFAFTKSLYEITAEKLWRQRKDFEILEFELKNLLNS